MKSEHDAFLSSGLSLCGKDGRYGLSKIAEVKLEAGHESQRRIEQQLWGEMSVPIYVTKACRPLNGSAPLPAGQDISCSPRAPPAPPPDPTASSFLPLRLRHAERNQRRLASLADHPASAASAARCRAWLGRALIGACVAQRQPLSCHTGSQRGHSEKGASCQWLVSQP